VSIKCCEDINCSKKCLWGWYFTLRDTNYMKVGKVSRIFVIVSFTFLGQPRDVDGNAFRVCSHKFLSANFLDVPSCSSAEVRLNFRSNNYLCSTSKPSKFVVAFTSPVNILRSSGTSADFCGTTLGYDPEDYLFSSQTSLCGFEIELWCYDQYLAKENGCLAEAWHLSRYHLVFQL
jgi:hypothetical protein